MITRRIALLAAAASLGPAALNHAPATAADDPAAILNAIYARVIKGKGDGGGTFVVNSKAAKSKYLSRSLIELWAKADARTAKGDGGPIGFDPVTNSQDPNVKSFQVAVEKSEADKAVLTVTIKAHGEQRKVRSDEVVRYEFVREAGLWKIDDIKGTVDGEAWSIRQLLVNYLKLFR